MILKAYFSEFRGFYNQNKSEVEKHLCLRNPIYLVKNVKKQQRLGYSN